MKTIRRHLATKVTDALKVSRVVNIVGPRQVGKTTLVRNILPKTLFFTLDDDAIRSALQADAYGQLSLMAAQAREESKTVVLDEIQRLPEATLAIKRLVDSDPIPGQFLLTGSSDILSSAKALDSLAGRAMTLTLRPFSASEILGSGPFKLLDLVTETKILQHLPKPKKVSRLELIDLIVRGGYPEIRALAEPSRGERYDGYLDSIIERDVAPITEVRKPDLLRRLIDHLAARTSEELNIQSLCRVLGARAETINDYIDVLTKLGIATRLGAWSSSKAKKEIKAAKIHFLDTGLATTLRGETSNSFSIGADPSAFGHLWETFFYSELAKVLPLLEQRWRLYHWRQDQKEIDIIAESAGKQLALFELKASSSVDLGDFRHINWFFEEGPGKSFKGSGFVIYLGDEILSFGPNRIALPASMLWSFK